MRLQQMGKNASGQTHYLSVSGLELYGQVTGVCEDLGRAAREAEANLRRQRRLVRNQMLKHLVPGARVVRGLDWKWRDQVLGFSPHPHSFFIPQRRHRRSLSSLHLDVSVGFSSISIKFELVSLGLLGFTGHCRVFTGFYRT